MTPCDPTAVAVDWLDAYRAARINQIVGMYSADAMIECACGGYKKALRPIGDDGSWMTGPWWFPIEPAAVSFRRC
jgi:hypothetical protein